MREGEVGVLGSRGGEGQGRLIDGDTTLAHFLKGGLFIVLAGC